MGRTRLVALALAVGSFVAAVAVVVDRDDVVRRSDAVVNVAPRSLARPANASTRPAPPRTARRAPRAAAPRPPLPLRSLDLTTRDERDGEHERALDELAAVRFDAAFAVEARDEVWAAATAQASVDAIATTDDALRIESLECRAALCRVELTGRRAALPPSPPFDGVVWWSGPDEGTATLLLVRDGAEPPLPSEAELG